MAKRSSSSMGLPTSGLGREGCGVLVLWRQTDQCSFVYLRCRPFAPVIQGLRTGRCAGELQKASRPCGRVAWPSGLRRGLPGADGRRRRRRPWRWRRPPWWLRPCTAMATAGEAVSAVAAAATPTDVDTMYCSDDGGRGGPHVGQRAHPPVRDVCRGGGRCRRLRRHRGGTVARGHGRRRDGSRRLGALDAAWRLLVFLLAGCRRGRWRTLAARPSHVTGRRPPCRRGRRHGRRRDGSHRRGALDAAWSLLVCCWRFAGGIWRAPPGCEPHRWRRHLAAGGAHMRWVAPSRH